MKLQMQSIHFDADKKLLSFIQKKLDKLETFHDRIVDGEVFLKIENDEKENKHVHVKLNLPGTSILAKESGTTFEEATDIAYESLKRQLKKQKEKLATY